jgi:enoyl-CoA hydratase/carnithine racemase
MLELAQPGTTPPPGQAPNAVDDSVTLEREGPVAILTLNNPARRNAFALAMREGLMAKLKAALGSADPCRAIVLTGAGACFCSGGDISEMKQRSPLEYRERNHLVVDIFRLMVGGPKPLVAAVEGFAMGAGVSLAAACDYVVSADNARYGCAFVKLGLLPDTGLLWSLGQKLGPARAREFMLSGREFDGRRAFELGFANQLVEAGKTREAAIQVAQRFAAMPPLALAMLKTALNDGCETLERAFESEFNLQPVLRRSADHKEAVKAFLEKRKPVFAGH